MDKVSILQWERSFRFRLFCGNGKFCHCSTFGNEWRVQKEVFAIAVEDSVDLVIIQGMLEVLVHCVMVKVVIELRVIDSVHVDMMVGSEKRFPKEGVMLLDV